MVQWKKPDFASFLPPLLPWQWTVLAAVVGTFIPHAEAPSLACAVVLFVLTPLRAHVAAGLFLGIFLSLRTLPIAPACVDAHDPSWPRTTSVRGTVLSAQSYPGERMLLVVGDVETLGADGSPRPLGANLVWSWDKPPHLVAPGSVFEARLRLRPLWGRANFGLPRAEERWLRRGVGFRAYSQGAVPVHWVRGPESPRLRILERFSAFCPEKVRGMLLAVVGGERFFVPPLLMDRVRRAGLAHSLALSGLHVGVVLGMGLGLASLAIRLWPRLALHLPRPQLAVAFGLPWSAAYLWLGGAGPSLVRAWIMACVAGVMLWRYHRFWPQDAVFAAAAVIVLLFPAWVLEPSAQLSFAAVSAIVILVPLGRYFNQHLKKRRVPRLLRWLLGLAGVSLAAAIGTAPLQLFWFGGVSVGVVWNLLWLPVLSLWVMPWAMVGLGFALVPGMETAGRLALEFSGWGVLGLEHALAWADSWGWLQEFALPRPSWMGWLALGVVFLLPWVRDARRIVMMLMALSLGWAEVRGFAPQGMSLTVLDTGSSQAVLLETPLGKRVLVDAGGSFSSEYDVGRLVVVPALTVQRPPVLWGALVSHADTDHLGGMPAVLSLMRVGLWGEAGPLGDGAAGRRLRFALDGWGGPRHRLAAGQRLEVEPGVVLEVLHPPGSTFGPWDNAQSVVLRVTWAGQGLAILPGDIPATAWEQLAEQEKSLAAQVLVLPHHGSRDALNPDVWAQVRPMHAVAACGPWNRFGHPHREVRHWLASHNVALWTTAQHGAVRFTWKTPDSAPQVRWARRPYSFWEDIMSTIMPTDQNLRQAVAWIEECRKDGKDLATLVTEAGMRFNLSPMEEQKLADIYQDQIACRREVQ